MYFGWIAIHERTWTGNYCSVDSIIPLQSIHGRIFAASIILFSTEYIYTYKLLKTESTRIRITSGKSRFRWELHVYTNTPVTPFLSEKKVRGNQPLVRYVIYSWVKTFFSFISRNCIHRKHLFPRFRLALRFTHVKSVSIFAKVAYPSGSRNIFTLVKYRGLPKWWYIILSSINVKLRAKQRPPRFNC